MKNKKITIAIGIIAAGVGLALFQNFSPATRLMTTSSTSTTVLTDSEDPGFLSQYLQGESIYDAPKSDLLNDPAITKSSTCKAELLSLLDQYKKTDSETMNRLKMGVKKVTFYHKCGLAMRIIKTHDARGYLDFWVRFVKAAHRARGTHPSGGINTIRMADVLSERYASMNPGLLLSFASNSAEAFDSNDCKEEQPVPLPICELNSYKQWGDRGLESDIHWYYGKEVCNKYESFMSGTKKDNYLAVARTYYRYGKVKCKKQKAISRGISITQIEERQNCTPGTNTKKYDSKQFLKANYAWTGNLTFENLKLESAHAEAGYCCSYDSWRKEEKDGYGDCNRMEKIASEGAMSAVTRICNDGESYGNSKEKVCFRDPFAGDY
jgi:hypothetical protein